MKISFAHQNFFDVEFREHRVCFINVPQSPEEKEKSEREAVVTGINTLDKLEKLTTTARGVLRHETEKSSVGGFLGSAKDKETHGNFREKMVVSRTHDTIQHKIHALEGRRWGIKQRVRALTEEKLNGMVGSENMRNKLIATQEELSFLKKQRTLDINELKVVHGMEATQTQRENGKTVTEFNPIMKDGEDMSTRGKLLRMRNAKGWQLLSQASYLHADYKTWREEHPILWGKISEGARLLQRRIETMDKIIAKLEKQEQRIKAVFEKHNSVKNRKEWITVAMEALNAKSPGTLNEDQAHEILNDVITSKGTKQSAKYKHFESLLSANGLAADIRLFRVNAEEVTRGSAEGKLVRRLLHFRASGSVAADYSEVQKHERKREQQYKSLENAADIAREIKQGLIEGKMKKGSLLNFSFNRHYAQEFRNNITGNMSSKTLPAGPFLKPGHSMYDLQRMTVVEFDDRQLQLSSKRNGIVDVIIDFDRGIFKYNGEELTLGVLERKPQVIELSDTKAAEKAEDLEISNKIRERIYAAALKQEDLAKTPGVRLKFLFDTAHQDDAEKVLETEITRHQEVRLLAFNSQSATLQEIMGKKAKILLNFEAGTFERITTNKKGEEKKQTAPLRWLDPNIEDKFEILK